MRRLFGAIVGICGLGVFAYGGIKFLTGAPSGDALAIAQNMSLSVGQCVTFGFIALVVGAILAFAS